MRSSLLIAVALSVGCSGDSLPEVVWSGELVDYAASPELAAALCAGTGPRVDEAAVRIADRLGVSDPQRFTYRWIPDRFDESPCGRGAGACAEADTVWSRTPMIDHEVVHVYAFNHGLPDPFLIEGLAEYLGGMSVDATQNDAAGLIGLGQAMSSPGFYSTAGHFVASAVAQSSLPQVLDLYGTSEYFDPPAVFEDKLRQATGLTVEGVSAHGRDQPRCGSMVYREDLVVCAADTTEVSAENRDPISIEEEMDCANADIWGRDGELWAERAVEIVEGGKFEVFADPDSTFWLTPCTQGCDLVEPIMLEPQEAGPDGDIPGQTVRLPQGRYGLRIRRAEPGTAWLEFSRG